MVSTNSGISRPGQRLRDCLGVADARKVRALTPARRGGFGARVGSDGPADSGHARAQGATAGQAHPRRATEDMLTMVRVGHALLVRMKTGGEARRHFGGPEFEAHVDGGAFADDSPGVMMLAFCLSAAHIATIPHIRTRDGAAYTNKLRAGAFRGFAAASTDATFAREMPDRCNRATAGLDPIDLRLKNAMQNGDRWIDGRGRRRRSQFGNASTARSAAQWKIAPKRTVSARASADSASRQWRTSAAFFPRGASCACLKTELSVSVPGP